MDLLRLFSNPYPALWQRIRHETQAMRTCGFPREQLWVQWSNGELHDVDRVAADTVVLGSLSRWRKFLALVRMIWKHSPANIHCHTAPMALIGSVARIVSARWRTRIVYEIHGAWAYEAAYKEKRAGMKAVRFVGAYLIEVAAILFADRVLMVSRAIERYYPIACFKKRTTIPRLLYRDTVLDPDGCESEALAALRQFVDVSRADGRCLLVYAGGLSKWQLIEDTISVMSKLVGTERFAGVCLTPDVNRLRNTIQSERSAESAFWFVASVPSGEVVRALELCDYGMLLREDNVVNRVASPTKLYEYLAAGVAPITTLEWRDISDEDRVMVQFSLAEYRSDKVDEVIAELAEQLLNRIATDRPIGLDARKHELYWDDCDERLLGLYRAGR